MASKDVIDALKKSLDFYGKYPYSDKSKEILAKTVDRTIKYFGSISRSALATTPVDKAKALIVVLNELKTDLKEYIYNAQDKAGIDRMRKSLKEYSKKVDLAYSDFSDESDRLRSYGGRSMFGGRKTMWAQDTTNKDLLHLSRKPEKYPGRWE